MSRNIPFGPVPSHRFISCQKKFLISSYFVLPYRVPRRPVLSHPAKEQEKTAEAAFLYSCFTALRRTISH